MYNEWLVINCIACAGSIQFEGTVLFTAISDLYGKRPTFTLTCVSTGGPVTCVTWKKDEKIISNANSSSILNNTMTGRYIHTLTVTGRLAGMYECKVANNQPTSTASQKYVVQST